MRKASIMKVIVLPLFGSLAFAKPFDRVNDGGNFTRGVNPSSTTSLVAAWSVTSNKPSTTPSAVTPLVIGESSLTLTPTSLVVSTTTSVSLAGSTETGSATSATYNQAIIDQHNSHRGNASVSSLTWSSSLADTAQQIAASCVYAHNTQANGGGYGQNIGAGFSPDEVSQDMITEAMYNNEISWYPNPYGQANPDMTNFEKWGHYSQIVWKNTAQVGCYTQYCPNGLQNTASDISPYFTVCNYSPPGNVGGEYGNNVLPPSS